MKLKNQNIRYILRLHVLIILSIIWISGSALAQTVLDSARAWVSNDHIDLYSGQSINDTISVYLSGSELKLSFKEIERTFPISNIAGNWTNLSQPGMITFNVQVLDLAGKGTLQRENGVLTLLIDLSERKDWMQRKFTLTNTQ